MLGTQFLDYVSKMQVATYVGVEDFADKFNFLLTVMVLLLCTAIVTVKQYILKPISCYIATEVGGKNLLEYVENYCWVQGTIPISYTVSVPENEEQWKKLESQKLLYYQWVPFVLGLQCILFYLPRVIWQMICYNRTGTDLQHLVTLASQAVHSQMDKREEMVQHLAESLEQLLFQHREIRTGRAAKIRRTVFKWCSLFYVSKRLGSRLFGTYLLVKLLYAANSIGQLFLMQSFLGMQPARNHNLSYSYFGATIAYNIATGRDWQTTLVFPRVGFCIIPIRQLMGQVFVTAQCALPVNMLNERVYMFLWFWILLNAIITLISIPIWFMRMAYQKSRTRFVKQFLRIHETFSLSKDKLMLEKFARQFLRHDGIFLLRMLSINAGEIICAEIVQKLWIIFKQKYFKHDFSKALGEEEDDCSDPNNKIIQLEGDAVAVRGCRTIPSAPFDKNFMFNSFQDELDIKKDHL